MWNSSTQDLFVCRDFVSGPCNLRVSFDPMASVEHWGSSADCAPYEWTTHSNRPSEDFAATLVRDWVSIPPGHFYGGTLELNAETYPELRFAGQYRITGRFSSGGFLGQNCYYKLKNFSKEIGSLPAKTWRGTVETNSVVVRVNNEKN